MSTIRKIMTIAAIYFAGVITGPCVCNTEPKNEYHREESGLLSDQRGAHYLIDQTKSIAVDQKGNYFIYNHQERTLEKAVEACDKKEKSKFAELK